MMAKNSRPCHWSLAPELQDDRQASVLYSPFRDKSLNPHSWNRKMKFWESLLEKTFMEQRMISFDVNKLPEIFERNGLTPKCLSAVVEQMKSTGQIRPISYYQKSGSWLSWGFNALVKQPLYWGVTQLIGSQRKEADVFVSPEVVKVVAEQVLHLYQTCVRFSVVDSLVSLAQLRESCQDLIPADQEFEIVITQLERDNHVALMQASNGDVVVKFRKEGESKVAFRDIDLNMYSIKTTMEKLEKEIAVLSSRVDEYLVEAKLNVKEGRKRMALASLRKKASLLKSIDKKSGSLTLLQDIVQKIEDAGTNEMVLKACQAGVQAMKTLNEEVTAERAEAVMDDVHEAMSNQEEIDSILNAPTSASEEEELERDLADLLKGDSHQEDCVDVPQLPSVPSSKPAASRDKIRPSDPVTDDIADAFLALELDDLGLPEVPTHSPSRDRAEGKKERVASSASASAAPSS